MTRTSIFSRLNFLRPLDPDPPKPGEPVSGGAAEIRTGGRDWEDFYRRRWQYDKKVRSTHGVNCTGSCSWDVYVKDGVIVWETQRTDYPECGPGVPDHEPRGCPRGATYSWYTYSPVRVNTPHPIGPPLHVARSAPGRPGPRIRLGADTERPRPPAAVPAGPGQGRAGPGLLGRSRHHW